MTSSFTKTQTPGLSYIQQRKAEEIPFTLVYPTMPSIYSKTQIKQTWIYSEFTAKMNFVFSPGKILMLTY
jgi:hypothetical protein